MKCKNCNNEMIKYAAGDDVEYICPVCDEEPATQIDNLIEFDSNQYVVKILTFGNYDKSMLKIISQICGCNVLEAKRILEETGKKFEPMDALETRSLKKRLDEEKIPYDISPDFNW